MFIHYTRDMNPIQALIMGLVEGVTEFLPISSTAHMIITAKILHINQTTSTAFFEIFIQLGAILAALILYFHLLRTHKHLVELVIESFVPTALIGIFAHKYIKQYFFQSLPINQCLVQAGRRVGWAPPRRRESLDTLRWPNLARHVQRP